MRIVIILLAVALSGCYMHRSTLQDVKQPGNAYKSIVLDRPFGEVKQAMADHERACGQLSLMRMVEDDLIRYSYSPYGDPNVTWVIVELQPEGEATRIDAFVVVRTWRSFADSIIAAAQNPTVCA